MKRGLPRRSSEAAAIGTMCHEVAETCLKKQTDAFGFIGRSFQVDGFDLVFTEDLCALTQAYIDRVREFVHG
jgi:hypothetical protein